MKCSKAILASVLTFFVIGCADNDSPGENGGDPEPPTPVPAINYSLLAAYPHDTSFFTEGIEFYNSTLLESTGEYGESRIVQTDVKTGKVLQQIKLDNKYFGEGLTVFRDTVYQLTWQEHVVLVYNVRDLKKINELPFNGQGWGLTNDGTHLIASNGSSDIYYYEPGSFKLIKVQPVKENGSPVLNINELEYVNGFVYANQWQYNYILKIDPVKGEVVAKMDLTELVNRVKAADPHAMELNGIAYNKESGKFFITGKNWPQIYEVQFDH